MQVNIQNDGPVTIQLETPPDLPEPKPRVSLVSHILAEKIINKDWLGIVTWGIHMGLCLTACHEKMQLDVGNEPYLSQQ